MLLALTAVMYLAALSLALCVVTPVPESASRRTRAARLSLACGGGAAITAAITLSYMGLWAESAVLGCVAMAIVCICLWVELAHAATQAEDEEDGSDGGGGERPFHPIGPAPQPLVAPDAWSRFDTARAGWARERETIGV